MRGLPAAAFGGSRSRLVPHGRREDDRARRSFRVGSASQDLCEAGRRWPQSRRLRFAQGRRAAGAREYVATLEQVDPRKLDRNDQFALLANLYNAKTLEIVASRYPVKSIKDISLGGGLVASLTGGPWKAKVIKLQGVELSLDDIEHGIMRPIFKDPRVHYAVNCASIGCPNLGTEAFIGAKLNAQLEQAAKDYVNSPRGVRFDNGQPIVSSIYVWYIDDFGGTDEGVLDHLRKYAAPDLEKRLAGVKSLGGDDYDWSLNDVAP